MDAELTSRTNTELFGHAEAEAGLLRDLAAGTLAHGWIINGPQGIGKATLAYRFARTLLGSTPQDDSVYRRMVAGSHSDLLVIEPAYDAKKEEYARDISVDQARTIAQFLSLTPGESQWRVVIVDSIDALNANAANAILKILEEPPPQAILLLVSHNPGRLLPTIRSRCRTLRLAPLDDAAFSAVMQHIAPDIDYTECNILAQLSNLSPGVAAQLHTQGAVALYEQLLALVASLPHLDTLKIHAFADQMHKGSVHANWQLFTRLMLTLLERAAKMAAGAGDDPALARFAALHPAAVWAAKWQQCADQFSLAERLHLDYKQVIITFFHSLAGHEKFDIGNQAA